MENEFEFEVQSLKTSLIGSIQEMQMRITSTCIAFTDLNAWTVIDLRAEQERLRPLYRKTFEEPTA